MDPIINKNRTLCCTVFLRNAFICKIVDREKLRIRELTFQLQKPSPTFKKKIKCHKSTQIFVKYKSKYTKDEEKSAIK